MIISEKTKTKLKDLDVGAVYLFGSHAEKKEGVLSDIDIAVLFDNSCKIYENMSSIYNKLYDIFSEIFDLSNFKNIDIVFLQRAPLELRFDVIKHGQILLDILPEQRINFEHNTAMLYMDYKPILENFNKAVLANI